MNPVDVVPAAPLTPLIQSGADDAVLQALAADAAADLDAPVVLATVVLEHIVLFVAHHGLTGGLLAAGGAPPEDTFCQRVVRDGAPLAITGAAPRAPHRLERLLGMKAYLGVPVRLGGAAVGTLCAFDRRVRTFTAAEQERLAALADAAGERYAALAHSAPASSGPHTAAQLLEALGHSSEAMHREVRAGLMAMSPISALLRLTEATLRGDVDDDAFTARTLEMAQRAAGGAADRLRALAAELQALEASAEALTVLSPTPQADAGTEDGSL